MEAFWVVLYRTSSIFMQAGSRSCPKLMTTTWSSSERIAWSTCQPLCRCGNMYKILSGPSRPEAKGLWEPMWPRGCTFCSSHLSHWCNKIPNTNDLKLKNWFCFVASEISIHSSCLLIPDLWWNRTSPQQELEDSIQMKKWGGVFRDKALGLHLPKVSSPPKILLSAGNQAFSK